MTFSDSTPNLIVTGGAGFIGSNLTLALQEKFPNAHLTVIDDFRSGNFKNLAGYRGDFVTQNLATLDWREQFGDPASTGFDAIFHLASITDTTLHDQFALWGVGSEIIQGRSQRSADARSFVVAGNDDSEGREHHFVIPSEVEESRGTTEDISTGSFDSAALRSG